jgi:hypothetical protein
VAGCTARDGFAALLSRTSLFVHGPLRWGCARSAARREAERRKRIMVLDDEARRRQLGRIGDVRQRRGRKPDVARKAVIPLNPLREIRSGMVDAKLNVACLKFCSIVTSIDGLPSYLIR